MVKVLSQSVSVDNFPSCTKGSSEMLSDIQKLEVKKKKKKSVHITHPFYSWGEYPEKG